MVYTAPALLVGLGGRIALDMFTRTTEPAVRDFILLGVWQGIGLHYSSIFPGIPFVVGPAILAKLFIEFQLLHDVNRSVVTLLGVAVGVLCTEFLSQLFDAPASPETEKRPKKSHPVSAPPPRSQRVVQFRQNADGSSGHVRYQPPPEEHIHSISDITSVDSSSEMLSKISNLTPSERLEREIKNLRMRASLADSERRRLKEERKWAISQGNEARASQMKWQVKHYTNLMQRFHREADAKLIEGQFGSPEARHGHNLTRRFDPIASGGRPPSFVTDEPKSSSRPSRHRKEHSDGQYTGITVPIADATQPPPRRVSKSAARESNMR
jgi:hypothetical protein